MITLIGTGHVFDLSSALLSIFDEKQPEVICVELDKQRYNAILMKKRNPNAYKEAKKNLPAAYKLLARFQENMANEYGVQAGDEMFTAITYAQSHQLPVAFIDMNAQQLFTNMWNSMPLLEKLKLIFSGFAGLFVSKKRVEEELKKYQDNFDDYIEEIGKKFPAIKTTLIDKRNNHMVRRLIALSEEHNNIIACMGDGHIPGISALLESKNIDFETIRLKELRKMKINESDSSTGHFSITHTPT